MTDAYRDAALDAGYRGDEADQVARTLEEEDRARFVEDGPRAAEQLADECAERGHPIAGSSCPCGENHL